MANSLNVAVGLLYKWRASLSEAGKEARLQELESDGLNPQQARRILELEAEDEGLFKGHGRWKYYGVLTNVVDYLENPQSILEHHMQRGNAENRIKAFKGDYDLRHLPCLKMNANFSYALMGMVALNFHRALSLVEDPKCPRFSKSFRERLIKIPGRPGMNRLKSCRRLSSVSKQLKSKAL